MALIARDRLPTTSTHSVRLLNRPSATSPAVTRGRTLNYTLSDGVRKCGIHRNRGLEHAGLSLKQNHPDLVISKHRLRQAESIALIRKNREEGTQNLCFSSR